MRIYFDCEFTTLVESERQLISAGFVSEDGARSLYVELADWNPEFCSDFTRAVVLPRLEYAPHERLTTHEFATCLLAWLDEFGTPVTLATDYSGDWALVSDALATERRTPTHPLTPIFVSTNTAAGVAAGRQFWREHADRQHHALTDAQCLRAAVQAAEAEIAARWNTKTAKD